MLSSIFPRKLNDHQTLIFSSQFSSEVGAHVKHVVDKVEPAQNIPKRQESKEQIRASGIMISAKYKYQNSNIYQLKKKL